MEKKLHTFFQSGLLDKYILDETSASESLKVEHYIETYPEVESEYLRLQSHLETLAKADAVEAPKFILDNILNEIKEDETPVIKMETSHRKTPWYSIAASIVALLFAGTSYMMYEQNQELLKENQVVVDEIFDLRSDIDVNNQKLDDVMRQFLKLNNPETEKYVLRGNARAKNLKTVAYINAVEKTSMIDVVSLPHLEKGEFVEVYAQIEDKFVSLGILDPSDKKMQNLPYMENALGLSLRIVSKKNSEANASDDEAVAEIELKTKNN
ncbi:RNA polymerase subunit sigma-70 [Psychroserpens luteus]|uniref:RNA polymerase subunit sigma-70 n=1 Tax=Psychroserpens luteus TaxID=1434066 RepID=A0ABW5ZZE8_9FLAO|nr:RNA polymerase subunit sigma-70 [Psychroserpens luteus]